MNRRTDRNAFWEQTDSSAPGFRQESAVQNLAASEVDVRKTGFTRRFVLAQMLCCAALSEALAAQGAGQPAVSVDSILSRFERDSHERRLVSRGADWVMDILQHSPPPSRRDSLLNGLRRLALESEDINVRLDATNYFGEAGSRTQRLSIVDGLKRIYESRNPALLRSMVLDKMPLQVERGAAITFLRSVAAEPDLDGPDPIHGYLTSGDPRTQALARLAEMGDEGAAALRAMHRGGEARSPQARIVLDDMARLRFPVRDLRRALAEQ